MIRKVTELWPKSWLYWGVLTVVGAYAILSDAGSSPRMLAAAPMQILVNLLQDPSLVNEDAVTLFIAFAAFFYGIRRIYAFHPIFDDPYLAWLSLTPYTGVQPLPCGPVQISIWDLPFLTLLSMATHFTPWLPWYSPLPLMLAGYIILAVGVIQSTIGMEHGRAVLAILGLAVGFLHIPWIASFIVLGLYAGVRVLLQKSLQRAVIDKLVFDPAHQNAYLLYQNVSHTQTQTEESSAVFAGVSRHVHTTATPVKVERNETDPTESDSIGWPLAILGPYIHPDETPLRGRVFTALIAGEWACAASHHLPFKTAPELYWVLEIGLPILIALLLLLRMSSFLDATKPPLTFWGRIGTGRLIIPGYDKVFFFPVLSVLSPWIIMQILPRAGAPECLAVAVAVTSSWVMAFSCPPRSKGWILRGHYRVDFSRTHSSLGEDEILHTSDV